MNRSFWQGKRVFLTGHTGFKGSWLSLWLRQLGAEVTGYSLHAPTTPNLFEVAGVESDLSHNIGDIRDAKALNTVMAECVPEIVIHMAAQPLVRYSYREPVETYETNVMGTLHVLEAIRAVGTVRAAVMVTTDKCYENREWYWGYRENEPMGGHDPYSSSKGCMELLTASYRNSYFSENSIRASSTAIATARAGNVIGGGDWAEDRLIPDMMNSFMKGNDVVLRNPHSIRPWQHVLEPLSGYLELARMLYLHGHQYAEAWNFGPDSSGEKTVNWIADYLCEKWNSKIPQGEQKRNAILHTEYADQLYEAKYLKLECSKAKSKLRWQPVWTLEQALDSIAEWYQSFIAGDDMREISISQVSEYTEMRSIF